MYLRITQRHNRDGSTVTYYALAESVWNAEAKRREAHVLHSFGRAACHPSKFLAFQENLTITMGCKFWL
jgi:hypothetical protein